MSHPVRIAFTPLTSRGVATLATLLFLSTFTWGCTDDGATSSEPDTRGAPSLDASGVDVTTRSDGETGFADAVLGEDSAPHSDAGAETQDTAPDTGLDYAGESNLGACGPNPSDATRYAIVGFWKSSDCAGEPLKTNAFPVNDTAGCYCWPGNSGQNSADSFACDPEAKTVTIIQYNSLTCGAGDDTPTAKTFHRDTCEQDIPPTLYSKVVDMGPCSN